MSKEIEIQDLPTVATNDIPFESLLPIGLRDSNKDKYRLFKITLKQLEIRLFHIQVETIFNAFEKDPNLTNLIYQLQDNLIIANYDETKLNVIAEQIQNNIIPIIAQITAAITDLNTGDLYNIHDEIARINQSLQGIQLLLQDQLDAFQNTTNNAIANIQAQLNSFVNLQNFNTKVFNFPALKDPNINNNFNNYQDFDPIYNDTIEEYYDKIIINLALKSLTEANKTTVINLYNFGTVFQNNQNSLMEVQILIANSPVPLNVLLYNKRINFFAGGVGSAELFTVSQSSINTHVIALQNQYSFSLFFNKNGYFSTSNIDLSGFVSQEELQSLTFELAQLIVLDRRYNVSLVGDVLSYNLNDKPYTNAFLPVPENVNSITQIVIDAGFHDISVSDTLTFQLTLPFYKIKAPKVTITVTIQSGIYDVVTKTIEIQNPKAKQQLLLIFDIAQKTLQYEVQFSEANQLTLVNLTVDHTKFNDINDVTAIVTEHSQELILNVSLKQPFLAQEGIIPEYFKPNIFPEQSEDMIPIFISSDIGALTELKVITVNLYLGDTQGFFKFFAINFTPIAAPANFSNPNPLLLIPSLGDNDSINGTTNYISQSSCFNFQIVPENSKNVLKLISSYEIDTSNFERQRQKQLQTLIQSFSTKLLDTTIYFPNSIVSTRSGLNLNFFQPNSEYSGSNVSAYVPIRETEYVFNGYLRLDLINDLYQNTQAISPYYFIKSEFHFVDYYSIDGVVFPRKANIPATYNFDEKQSKTILIFVNNLTDIPRDFYFNIDCVFALRTNFDSDFYVRVINRNVPVKLTDPNPDIQVLPNFAYGVQYSSADTQFVFEKKIAINKINTGAPLQIEKQKLTFAVRLSTDFAKCKIIPYEPPIFVTSQVLEQYPTLAEVQALIAGVATGGTIDLSEYAKKIDLTALENQINNYVVQTFATKNELAVATNTANAAITNIANLTNILNNNYYTKQASDEKFALIEDFATNSQNLLDLSVSVDNVKAQYVKRIDADSLYSTKLATQTIKNTAQAAIPQVITLSDLPTYKEIPASAKLTEIFASTQQIRDKYIGFLDKDYSVDDGVILHLKITVTKTNFNVWQNFPLQGHVTYEPLGEIINGEFIVDFKHNNSRVSDIRPDLRGSIISNVKFPIAANRWNQTYILGGTRHVSNTTDRTWMHPYINGPVDTNDEALMFSNNGTPSQYYSWIPEQAIGADNIPKAMHSTLMTGQIPINICFALKTHRPIYIEIINPDAPVVNVTCTFMVEKENEFGWIQPNTAYSNSTFLVFTNSISQPIPNELQYIFNEFKVAGYRLNLNDARATIDGIQLPTLNGTLAYTASVFPDFFATEVNPLKCKNGYFDHPSNLYYYIIMRYGAGIYKTKKSDYLNYSVKYDGRTVDLKTSIKFYSSKSTVAKTSLYLSNACKSYNLITDNFDQNLYDVCWKYIIRKDFSSITRLAGWSEHHCLTDVSSKGVLAIKPNSYILYVEPNSILPSDVLINLFDAPLPGGTANTKIYNLAKTFDDQSKTKWIAIHLLCCPSKSAGRFAWTLGYRPAVGRPVPEPRYNDPKYYSNVTIAWLEYQGKYIETWFDVLDSLPADTNYVNK